jgi:phosphopantothenoylcysteine synthetase/decarboxylase
MNTMMWEHPFTARHLKTLRELGVQIIDPVPKLLACGDYGQFKLALLSCQCERDVLIRSVQATERWLVWTRLPQPWRLMRRR